MDYLIYPFALVAFTSAFFMIGFYVGQSKERDRIQKVRKKKTSEIARNRKSPP